MKKGCAPARFGHRPLRAGVRARVIPTACRRRGQPRSGLGDCRVIRLHRTSREVKVRHDATVVYGQLVTPLPLQIVVFPLLPFDRKECPQEYRLRRFSPYSSVSLGTFRHSSCPCRCRCKGGDHPHIETRYFETKTALSGGLVCV